MNKNIVLIGFMGCGKSTIARKLAKIFKRQLVDTDILIEERMQMSIKDIFATYGEEYFRKLECELKDELSLKNNLIISCGGGFANLENIKTMGFVVYIYLPFFIIKKRVKNNGKRPLFDDKAKKLYNKRLALYEKNADIKIDNSKLKFKEFAKICEFFLNLNLHNTKISIDLLKNK
ncbi:shikimate kinase [Campylobacter canadensis]|uniref:Shikimate kinase n=1 Tax=Campylobacter canadensis TaxID=449520 RepID=A0ABS7WTE0_9BACT|nr:shikimate kinase [Campylobacter canadensis]MBZ7987552.1 shikimate kinase [Campylobacter canadensis]MBZ7994897.1 shikimate kinase [Campylobacter canadensis]MBZ7996716.1 shikimate kinase [Campylobacter canadensis]MBZ7998692.1 shikimate kinase [Campylobacter canadensis]MBZ8000314.1 shikimate kinase [Campylobacter canadensis]